MKKRQLFCLILSLLAVNIHAANLTYDVYHGKLIPQSNSVVLSTDKEAMVIDAQFLQPDGREVLKMVQATGKPLTSILLTHDHPDHVWGAKELLKQYPNAKVYARQAVKDDIDYKWKARLLRWTEDFPEHLPTSLFDIHVLEGDTFDFDGHEIKIIDLIPAETLNATGYYITDLKTYVAGDQIFYKFHAYIGAGLNRPDSWIDSLEDVRDNYNIQTVIPGHGPVDDGDKVFSSAIEYLEEYMRIYAPLKKQSLIAKHMIERFPDYDLKEVLFMTTGPAVTAPDLIEMMQGNLGFSEEH